jgi:hypothetical protein
MANLPDHVNADTKKTEGDNLLLFHGPFLRICPPERHTKWEVLDERPWPAWMFLSSLIAYQLHIQARIRGGNHRPLR